MFVFPAPYVAGATAEAFPVVEATNQGGTSSTSAVSSFDVPLPSGIQAGDLLIIVVSLRANNSRNISAPSGWDQLFHVAGSGDMRLHAAFYRTADGGEGSTVSVTTSNTSLWATNSYRISGAQGTPEATTATGSSSTPNPPSLSPSWGSAKTLWIATEGDLATSTTLPTLPSNYTDRVSYSSVFFGSSDVRTTSGRRDLESASEDPGTFGLGGSGFWVASTIAVQPA